MAQFKWLGEGEIPRDYVASYGPTTEIKLPCKDGSWQVLTDGAGFPVDQVIEQEGSPVDFTDERTLRVMRADPRFEEVI
jgi:hypothetical protein